jgi:hypothetical protein
MICKDCRYARITTPDWNDHIITAFCGCPDLAQIDSVTVEKLLVNCYDVNKNGKCTLGEEGKALIQILKNILINKENK